LNDGTPDASKEKRPEGRFLFPGLISSDFKRADLMRSSAGRRNFQIV
jgi:hypothetical protein